MGEWVGVRSFVSESGMCVLLLVIPAGFTFIHSRTVKLGAVLSTADVGMATQAEGSGSPNVTLRWRAAIPGVLHVVLLVKRVPFARTPFGSLQFCTWAGSLWGSSPVGEVGRKVGPSNRPPLPQMPVHPGSPGL